MELSQRNLAIDVLRGLTVAVMIIVNTPGSWASVYSPFLHADWHGFTLTDWVFPSFLFVVGNAMSFSFSKFTQEENGKFLAKVVKRSLLIFLIGYLLLWFPFIKYSETGEIIFKPWETTRVFGVLQRIAICYFAAALLIRYLSDRGVVIGSVIILVGYQLILLTWGDYTLENNAIMKLDQWLIGGAHMYHGEGIAFDPEGLLSTLPAIVNVIGGYFAGRFVLQKGSHYETIAKLMALGAVLIFLGLWWDLFFPINKKLWTSSYVVYSIGINLLLLSVLVYVIEILNKRRWAYPFEIFGKNTLFIYVLSGIVTKLILLIRIGDLALYNWLYVKIFEPAFGNYNGSLMFALFFIVLYGLVGLWMDKRKIYIKI